MTPILLLALLFQSEPSVEVRKLEAYARREAAIAKALRTYEDELEKINWPPAAEKVAFHHAGKGPNGEGLVSISVAGEMLDPKRIDRIIEWLNTSKGACVKSVKSGIAEQ